MIETLGWDNYNEGMTLIEDAENEKSAMDITRKLY